MAAAYIYILYFLQVHLDMSNQQVGLALKRALADGWSDFFRSLLADCEFPAQAADIPGRGPFTCDVLMSLDPLNPCLF